MSAPPFSSLHSLKSDFDVVKSKVDPVHYDMPVSIPPAVSVPPFSYLQCFKLDVDDVKSRVGLFKKMIKTICCMVFQPLYPYQFLIVCVFWPFKV